MPIQRECTMATCHRLDVQPGRFWEEGEYHDVAYCPEHAHMMRERFIPTPPDAESLRAANDEMLTTGRGERVACYCGGRALHMWQPPLCPVVRVTEPVKKTCWCRVGPRGHVYDPSDRCPDDHPTDPFNGPRYTRAADGNAVLCVCSRTRALHHWNRDLGCPPDLDPKEDPVNGEVSAQVQCYCTGRSGKSIGGHLWRTDTGCPRSPVQPLVGAYRTPAEQSDDQLLADLFKRAVQAGQLSIEMRFHPDYQLVLRAGDGDVQKEIALSNGEVDALRRRVA